MEKLLLVWVKVNELKKKQWRRLYVICEKARIIYDDLKKKAPSSSEEAT